MPLTLALPAMGTRFELVLSGKDEAELRAAGEEAFAEIEAVERMISPFRSDSETSRLHREAGGESLPMDPLFWSFLHQSRLYHGTTGGRFDPTVGPLIDLWGIRDPDGPRTPSDDEIAACLEYVGFGKVFESVRLEYRGRLTDPRARVDVGACGKGFAIDQALEVLRDVGVRSALIHGGTSTVAAIGSPPGQESWKVGLGEGLPTACLRDGHVLSVSTPFGRSRDVSHVIDPRTGRPTAAREFAAVVTRDGFAADALSTALLVEGCPADREHASLVYVDGDGVHVEDSPSVGAFA